MAELQYYTLLTKAGNAAYSQAATGTAVSFATVAVGDGGGNVVQPLESWASLQREVWRGHPSLVYTDQETPQLLHVEVHIPHNVGGFVIREVGLFDENNTLLAVCNYPDTVKPSENTGAGKEVRIDFLLEHTNADKTVLKIDPSIVMASREYADKVAQAKIAKHNSDATAHPGTYAAANHTHTHLVPTTRSITTVAPLTGGGSLGEDLTLGLKAGPDNTYLGSQNGKNIWLPWPFGQAVSTDVVWYVRPDGNDENAKAIVTKDINGSENTPEKSFKTVSAAVNHFTKNYYVTGQGAITIQLGGTGTYTEPAWVNFAAVSVLSLEPFPPQPLGKRSRARFTISGDKNNRVAYVWSMQSNPAVDNYAATLGNWSYEGLSIVITGALTTYGVYFSDGGQLWNSNVTAPSNNIVVSNELFSIVGTCNITATGTGGAAAFHGSSAGCRLNFGDAATSEPNTVITLNCPAANSLSLSIHTFARVVLYNNASLTGNVNGKKYSAQLMSLITTYGRLATIPGSSTGTIDASSVAG